MAELFMGRPLTLGRWLDGAEEVARRFERLCAANSMVVEVSKAGKLWTVTSPGKFALIAGHPLWHHREALAQDTQLDAAQELRSRHGSGTRCRFVDVRELAANPQRYVVELGQAA
jgi:DEAD/DEAH box helicase domain-containing protein